MSAAEVLIGSEPTQADRLALIDEALERCREIAQGVAGVRELAARRRAPIDQWEADAVEKLEKDESYWRQRIEQLAQGLDYGKRRSVDLPYGRVGLRKRPDKLEVQDEAALIEWCKRENVPLNVAVKPAKAEIAKHIKANGVEPDGAEWVAGTDEFYVEVGS